MTCLKITEIRSKVICQGQWEQGASLTPVGTNEPKMHPDLDMNLSDYAMYHIILCPAEAP